MKRHPRGFWAKLVDEVARGATVETVAGKHGVLPRTLRWWQWKLTRSTGTTTAAAPRLVPVVVTGSTLARESAGHVDVALRGLVVRVATGTDVAYVASLLRALEPC